MTVFASVQKEEEKQEKKTSEFLFYAGISTANLI